MVVQLTESDRSVSFDRMVRVRQHLHKVDMSASEKQATWYSVEELHRIREERPGQRRRVQAQASRFECMKDDIFQLDDSSRLRHTPMNEMMQRHMLDLARAIRSSSSPSPECSPASFSVRKTNIKPAHEELQKFNAAMLQALPTSPLVKNRKHRYLRKPLT